MQEQTQVNYWNNVPVENCILNWNWLFALAEIQLRIKGNYVLDKCPLAAACLNKFEVFHPSTWLCPCRSCSGGRGQEGLGLSQQHRPLLVTGGTTAFQHSWLWGQILREGSFWLSVQSINRLQFFPQQIAWEKGLQSLFTRSAACIITSLFPNVLIHP